MADPPQSVSHWIAELKQGDPVAATEIWNRYYAGLIQLARRRLSGSARRVADEEDVVVDAFNSFFRRTSEGLFPNLNDRDDLWCLLVTIAERKAWNLVRDEQRQKRGGGRVSTEAELPEGLADRSLAPEPTPEFAAMAVEEFERLLELLDGDLQRIALLKLEGYGTSEIASRQNRSKRTVERRLAVIRSIWEEEV